MKLYRWGTYTRSLVLWSGETVNIIVQRFYSPETKRTYSLLPFYITPYQRYENRIIEDVLTRKLIWKQSCNQIERDGPPLRRTISRWTKRMLEKLEPLREGLAKHLIQNNTEYVSVDTAKVNATEKFGELLSNGEQLASGDDILQYGSLSYIQYCLQ